MVVESRSVIRNAKNARGLGRDRAAEPVRIFLTACSGISATATFPKSCASYFRFAPFNTLVPTILSESLAQARAA